MLHETASTKNSGENGASPLEKLATDPVAQPGVEEWSTFSIPKAVSPQTVPDGAALDHPALYFNRELGWLDFNWRVLHLAMDERTPLLERVRFHSYHGQQFG